MHGSQADTFNAWRKLNLRLTHLSVDVGQWTNTDPSTRSQQGVGVQSQANRSESEQATCYQCQHHGPALNLFVKVTIKPSTWKVE